ncbi:Thioredoxin-like domain-containing protein [Bosea sp. CRIB-10]|uniref:thioredoxin family protein n=1 Tax=Bosea sp. CRIB-10 TaxID=378404 RepID=UPI0008E4869A|nr:thioredoxin family protein [Bosea sp. CRIB-10]SFD13254.1 Thioredoxin-like domain-containing protein [Bosea sp. CRIB-10]
MITRRGLLASTVVAMSAPALAKAKLGEDGLYQEDWYLESFLDLAEDLTNASQSGKRFVILWGLRNCPACRRMHEVHLADPAIESYIRDNFAVLHLNILGAREVTDFGGGKLTEKALAKRYGIEGTPAIQFFPTSAAGLAAKPPKEREVARMASLPEPQAFIAQFRAVRNGV